MSSNVFLSNIDDYLAPSQACINPLFTTDKSTSGKEGEEKKDNEPTLASSDTTTTTAAIVVPKQRHRRKRVSARIGNNIGNGKQLDIQAPAVPSDPVKASIQDCLACSGCVTTAETVLMEQQHSLTILREMVANRTGRAARIDTDTMDMNTDLPEIVVTVSPASWADLLRHIMGGALDTTDTPDTSDTSDHRQRLREYQRKLTTLLHRTLRVSIVMDGNLPLQWSLQQAGDEFCRAHDRKTYANQTRGGNHHQMQDDKYAARMDIDVDIDADTNTDTNTDTTVMSEQERLQQQLMPSQALSSSQSVYRRPDGTQLEVYTQKTVRAQQALPIITSSCPAVVCLLEKSTHAAVPHLSTTKSSMAAAGAYWKQQEQQQEQYMTTTTTTPTTIAAANTSTKTKTNTNKYFHLAIMPCHDKKLEASRKDFQQDASAESPKDVDMVITTRECFQLILELLVAAGTADATATASASATSDANNDNDMEGKDTVTASNDNDTSAAGIAMVRDYLESLPMAPVEESVGPCHAMTMTLDERNSTARTKDSVTLMALPSTTTATTTTTTATTGRPAPTLLPSTPTSASTDVFFPLGSGGYADHVFRYAAHEIYGVVIDVVPWTPVTGAQVLAGGSGSGTTRQQQQQQQPQQPRTSARVATSAQRRRDFYQATLYRSSDGKYFSFDEKTLARQSGSNEAVLRFAVAYGMQTIQRVFEPFQDKQQTASTSLTTTSMAAESPYDYIEAMACPSGCLNGGGQNRVAERETPTETRQRVSRTSQFFVATDAGDSKSSSSSSTAVVKSPLEPAQLVTSYHVVPPLELSMGAAAGVAVKDIEW
jgi:iron only hydrogenase large subunit-like protein